MHFAGFIDRNFYEVAELSRQIDDRIIPIDISQLALTALSGCNDNTIDYIEVGSSAADITQYLPKQYNVYRQSIVAQQLTRSRKERVVTASRLPATETARCYIDDVAVSGATLEAARRSALNNEGDRAVVGMAWDSKRLRQRVGMPMSAAITYRQDGGGTPAVNSLATFVQNRTLASEYAVKKFNNPTALDAVLEKYNKESL